MFGGTPEDTRLVCAAGVGGGERPQQSASGATSSDTTSDSDEATVHDPISKEDYLDLWRDFQQHAYDKVTEANGGKQMPAIIWTNSMTEEGVEKYLDPENYIIQIWAKLGVCTIAHNSILPPQRLTYKGNYNSTI